MKITQENNDSAFHSTMSRVFLINAHLKEKIHTCLKVPTCAYMSRVSKLRMENKAAFFHGRNVVDYSNQQLN